MKYQQAYSNDNQEPLLPDIDYKDLEKLTFLRQNLDERYEQIKNINAYGGIQKKPRSQSFAMKNESQVQEQSINQNEQNNDYYSKLGKKQCIHIQQEKQIERDLLINQNQSENLEKQLIKNQLQSVNSLAPFLQSYFKNSLMDVKQKKFNQINTPNPNLYKRKLSKIQKYSPQIANFEHDRKYQNFYDETNGQNYQYKLNNFQSYVENFQKQSNANPKNTKQQYLSPSNKRKYSSRKKMTNQQFYSQQKQNSQNLKQTAYESPLNKYNSKQNKSRDFKNNQGRYQSTETKNRQQNPQTYITFQELNDNQGINSLYSPGKIKLNIGLRDKHIQNSEVYIRDSPLYDADPDNPFFTIMNMKYNKIDINKFNSFLQKNFLHNSKFMNNEEKQLFKKQLLNQYPQFEKSYLESYYFLSHQDSNEITKNQNDHFVNINNQETLNSLRQDKQNNNEQVNQKNLQQEQDEGENINQEINRKQKINLIIKSPQKRQMYATQTSHSIRSFSLQNNKNNYFLQSQQVPNGEQIVSPSKKGFRQKLQQQIPGYSDQNTLDSLKTNQELDKNQSYTQENLINKAKYLSKSNRIDILKQNNQEFSPKKLTNSSQKYYTLNSAGNNNHKYSYLYRKYDKKLLDQIRNQDEEKEQINFSVTGFNQTSPQKFKSDQSIQAFQELKQFSQQQKLKENRQTDQNQQQIDQNSLLNQRLAHNYAISQQKQKKQSGKQQQFFIGLNNQTENWSNEQFESENEKNRLNQIILTKI